MQSGEAPESVARTVPQRVDEATSSIEGEQPTLESLRPPRRRLPAPWRLTKPVARSSTPVRLVGAGVLVALLAGLVAVVLRSQPPDLQFAPATAGTVAVSFTTVGTLQSASYDVNFAAAGKVAGIDVQVGEDVKEGQTLARLDTTRVQGGVKEAP